MTKPEEGFKLTSDGLIILERKSPKNKEKSISINEKYEKSRYIDEYTMSVGIEYGVNRNVGRNLPLVDDGLNFVQRRMLWVMFIMKLFPGKHRAKLNDIIGAAMGTVYPHGEASPAITITTMGRAFSMMLTYVDKEGNFGNIASKSPSASRYISGRLTEYAMDCFFSELDIDEYIMDMRPNYKYDGFEPIYLPSKYPNALIQWNSGIGIGASSKVVGFNPTDAMQAAITLIDDPTAKINIYPDSPYDCVITNKSELKGCFDKSQFRIVIRGRYKKETEQDRTDGGKLYDKHYLVFSSIPPDANASTIVNTLTKIKAEEENQPTQRFKEIKDAMANAEGDSLDLRFEYEKGYDPDVIAEKLFKSTNLQDTVSANYMFIKNNRPTMYTPRTILLEWIHNRIDQKRRYIIQRIKKCGIDALKCRIIILVIDSGKAEQIIKDARKATSKSSFIEVLTDKYNFNIVEAQTIASMEIYRFTKNEMEKAKARLKDLEDEYNYYKNILNTDSIKEEIKKELLVGIKKYGRKRRAELTDLNTKTFDPSEEKTIFYNNEQYYAINTLDDIKNIPTMDSSYKMISVKNSDTIMLFNKDGAVKFVDGNSFSVNVTGISTGRLFTKNIVSIIKLTDKVRSVVLVTEKGFSKNIEIKDLLKTIKGKVINLTEDDQLAGACSITKSSGIITMFAADKMYYTKLDASPKQKKGSSGNKIIKNLEGVISGIYFLENTTEEILIYGESGYVKLLSTKYLTISKKDDNYISMMGKGIFGILPLSVGEHIVNMIDNSGISEISIGVHGNKFAVTVNNDTVNHTASTSISSAVKIFKKNKLDLYILNK